MDGPLNELVVSPDLAPPVGYSHAVVAAEGTRAVYVGGMIAHDSEGRVVGSTVTEQFDVAAANVVTALRAAGGVPDDIVSLVIYTTDVPAYRENLRELGRVYQRHFGRRYPAMALFGVTALLEPAALVELVAVAHVQERTAMQEGV